jgi:hypothetical protein
MEKRESAEPNMQHGRLKNVFGNWNQPMVDRMSQFGKGMYCIAKGASRLPRD